MDRNPLTVVAVFHARPGAEGALAAELEAMLEPTRRESGCVNYDLHAAIDDPGLFFFHETWTSSADHQAHLLTGHVRHLLSVAPDLIDEPIRELKGSRIEA